MAFTAAELANIANAAIDFHMRSDAFDQSIQDKPLMKALVAKAKTFPGGKENITIPVKGIHTTAIQGFTHNDTVTYANPANIKRASFPWKEIHAGIEFTQTELKIDGISVVDSSDGKSTTNHSDRELTALTGLLQDKLQDMDEGYAETFDAMLHRDGTQDAKQTPGIKLLIADDPTVGTLGGIDRVANSWWRNRSLVGLNKITASASAQTLTRTLRSEVRQLKRYGKGPDLIICGSQFLDALELEVQEKGIYTQAGFANKGKTDIGLAAISMMGVGDFVYDPTLDLQGRGKFAYFIDTSAIMLDVMQGEDRKMHNPKRPHNAYVFYRAMTWTGAMIARQLNTSAVYEIA